MKHTTVPLSPKPTNNSHRQHAPGPLAESHGVQDARFPEVPGVPEVPAYVESAEDVEPKDLTGQECIEQYPELWEQFNKIYDDTGKDVDRDEQAEDVPEGGDDLLRDAPAPAVPVAVMLEPKTVSETQQLRRPCRRLGQSPTPTFPPSLHASGHLTLEASRT